ncbi:ABC transporter substrate-binding protein [Pseudoalteromonas mariniglutinosa]|uniref:ABC transporter substrate-binding protein n=1 Tax=Pseudoalteromonas mariniglutinosa TaxID=206042 RepID=UPI00384B9951
MPLIRLSLGLTWLLFSLLGHANEAVTLKLKWTHQFQFAGYYMAQHKGYYKGAGLDVTIQPADPENPDTFADVLAAKAEFGISHSGILQQRINGQPLVAMAAILQFSPYCWMVKKNADIFQPRDFAGKTLSNLSRKENAELLVMLERAGVSISQGSQSGHSNAVKQWLSGELDALQVYVTNEPYLMTQQGIEHRLICPQKYGINVYSDILYTTEAMLKSHPDVVARFYQASLKGWRYALMNMDESIAVTHQLYAPEKSVAQLAYEAEILHQYILPPGTRLGSMSMAKWRLIADLYGIEQDNYNAAKKGFVYQHGTTKSRPLSWMLIMAILLTLLCIPLYFKLLLKKQTNRE